MAEFCLECFNKMFNTNYEEKDVVLEKIPELCEGCKKYKQTVIVVKKRRYIFPE